MHFKFYFKIVVSVIVILSSNHVLAQNTVTKYYITKDGVKTPIVFDPFSKDSEKSKFLYDNSTETDKTSRYDKLKDAIGDTNTLSDLIDTIQNRSTDSGGTFSLDGAKRNLELLNKENNKNSNVASSFEELVFLKEKYGNLPSFFINDIEVEQEVYDKVLEKEILNKQIYVKNTISGNPNGERRLTVSDRTLKRLNIASDVLDTSTDHVNSYAFAQPEQVEKDVVIVKNEYKSNDSAEGLDSLLKQIKELNNNNNSERGAIVESNSQNNTPSLKDVKKEKKQNSKLTVPQHEIVYSYEEINNKPKKKTEVIKVNEEEVFVVRSSDWKRTEMENLNNNNNGEKEEKRSIRDIKNRERSK